MLRREFLLFIILGEQTSLNDKIRKKDNKFTSKVKVNEKMYSWKMPEQVTSQPFLSHGGQFPHLFLEMGLTHVKKKKIALRFFWLYGLFVKY